MVVYKNMLGLHCLLDNNLILGNSFGDNIFADDEFLENICSENEVRDFLWKMISRKNIVRNWLSCKMVRNCLSLS